MYNVYKILRKNLKKLKFIIMTAFSYTSINEVLHNKDDSKAIYRIFYMNLTNVHAVYLQRILRFPCFMGFYFVRCQSDSYKVYSLRLKTFSKWRTETNSTPFTEITYNITVYGYYGKS